MISWYIPQAIYIGIVFIRLVNIINQKFNNKSDMISKTIGAILAEIFFVVLLYTGGFFK